LLTGPDGSANTAAAFLSQFVGGVKRWAHLDIAGVSNDDGKLGMATGRPVGLLAQWLMDRAQASAWRIWSRVGCSMTLWASIVR